MYLLGGQTIPDIVPGPMVTYSDVWRSVDGAAWTKIADGCGWGPRGSIFSAVSWRGYMWVACGGIYPSAVGAQPAVEYCDVWRSPDGITWELVCVSSVPPRRYQCLAVFDDELWILGGYANGLNRNDVWHTSDGVIWERLYDSPFAESHASTAWSTSNGLYFACGINLGKNVYKLSVVP